MVTEHDILQRKDFETPKVKGKFLVEEMDAKAPKGEYVPHSTLISRLEELKKMSMIVEYDSGKRSKKKLPIKEYSITFLGLLKLFQLESDKKSLSDIWNKITVSSHLITYKRMLEYIFTKKQLTDTLRSVYENVNINIITEPKKKSKSERIQDSTAWELLKGKFGVKIYVVEITMNFPLFSHTIIEQILIHAQKINGKIKFLDNQAVVVINKIIICAFLHELVIRSSLVEYVKRGYPREKGKFLILHLKQDNELSTIYKGFLDKIENQRRFEEDIIKEIRKSFQGSTP